MKQILGTVAVAVLSIVVVVMLSGCDESETDTSQADGSPQVSQVDDGTSSNNTGEVADPGPPANIAGSWHIVQHLDGSDASMATYEQITQSGADIMVRILTIPGPPFSPNGEVSGHSVTFSSGTEVFTGTIAQDGNSMSGTWRDTADGRTGAWDAERE